MSESEQEPTGTAACGREKPETESERQREGRKRENENGEQTGWAGSGEPPGRADRLFRAKAIRTALPAQAARRRSASSGTPSAARLRITSSDCARRESPAVPGRPRKPECRDARSAPATPQDRPPATFRPPSGCRPRRQVPPHGRIREPARRRRRCADAAANRRERGRRNPARRRRTAG